MKKAIVLSLCLIFSIGIMAQDTDAIEEDIKNIVKSAYVDGLQNYGDFEKIDAGFHPGFNLLGVGQDNGIWKYPIYSWKESVQARLDKGELPKSEDKLVTCEFLLIDVTGDAAIVKIELYQEGNKIYTDYLSLYKFKEGWKIVNKIFHSHN